MFKGVPFRDTHVTFTVIVNFITFTFFVGDENKVQKFEGESSQPIIFSRFVHVTYTLFPTGCNDFIFSDHVFFSFGINC